MTKPYSIGVAGYAGAGKDTLVNHLVDAYGFKRIAFADPLREFVAAVNPIVHAAVEPREFEEIVEDDEWLYEDRDAHWTGSPWRRLVVKRYNDVLEEVGYNEAKFKYPEVRNLLQRVGTEGARETFWDNFWVDLAVRRAEQCGSHVAYSDLRFPNEAEAADFTIWVSRPGVEAVNSHASDNSLNDWDFDYVIANDGTISDLNRDVDDMIREINSRATALGFSRPPSAED